MSTSIVDALATAEANHSIITITRRGPMGERECDWIFRVTELEGLRAKGFWLAYGQDGAFGGRWLEITPAERKAIVAQATAEIRRRQAFDDAPRNPLRRQARDYMSLHENPTGPSYRRQG